jgi:hypothetical protein
MPETVDYAVVPDCANFPPIPPRNWTSDQDAILNDQIAQFKKVTDLRMIEFEGVHGHLIAVANGKHFGQKTGGGPLNPRPGTIIKNWYFDLGEFEGVFCERDANGRWATTEYHASEPGLQYTCREFQDFLRTWGGSEHFRNRVPKFVTRIVPAREAASVFYGNGPAADFPLARVIRQVESPTMSTTWNRQLGAHVGSDGQLKLFNIEQFKRVFPFVVTGQVTPPGGGASTFARIQAVNMLMQSDMSDDELLASIREKVCK